jgi:ADP-heptose:LPS heptosyltransferase
MLAPSAKKVLVMELAGLGDNVHLLPALWLVRRQWPDAKLHIMVNAHVQGLFKLTPWVDQAWAYPSSPKPGLGASLGWARNLRAEGFDCVVNTTGSDRSSMLTFATGAPIRVGRRPADGGPPGWSLLFTHVMEHAHYEQPMYVQKWECLRDAGFGSPGDKPDFHVTIDPALRAAAGIQAQDERRYIHVSPFTTADERELPASQVAQLVAGLRAAHPELRIVLSCAGNARETAKLDRLVRTLDEPPWQVYAGTLGVDALAAVIEKSALSLSGDTGSLHLAMMTGAPAVAWFRTHKGEREWIPEGAQYRVLISEGGPKDCLHGIETPELLEACAHAIAAGVKP